jgi:hypothetical protein
MTWTTRLPDEYARRFGLEAHHVVAFEPDGWCGTGDAVALWLPDLNLFHFVNRGSDRFQVRPYAAHEGEDAWSITHEICVFAAENDLFLVIHCDDEVTARKAAAQAAKLLPRHRRSTAVRLCYWPETALQ